uniref:Secreted protein n=1 Tax=Oryza sativa subsp. japonica TaxID=39947 RepID=Q69RK8_ORYSJ|nr:hypothetical protein [Oryza sativa Japonica Group]
MGAPGHAPCHVLTQALACSLLPECALLRTRIGRTTVISRAITTSTPTSNLLWDTVDRKHGGLGDLLNSNAGPRLALSESRACQLV